MTFTLAWKELREHQGVWLTMVCMTVGLGLGLAKVVSLNDGNMALPVAAFTILGMAATYGIVCGSMMFAGEHEGGTLVFLDIFLGRRGLLWTGKFAIGALLVVTQALGVAMILALLNQQAPHWAMALVGQSADLLPAGAVPEGAYVWCLILPVVTLEAFAWGMLGSALTQRVLASAAIAAVGFTPIWLLALTAPGPVFFPFRVLLAVGLLLISATTFINQSREAALGPPPPEPGEPLDPKDQFLAEWDRYERKTEYADAPLVDDAPISVPEKAIPAVADDPFEDRRAAKVSRSFEEEPEQAESPREVLWWLTLQQARPLLVTLALVGFLLGILFLPLNFQVLWPLATLLLGVTCGAAAFAPEQRDLSYQFLAAQHFPLKVIWRFKVGFWLAVALAGALIVLAGTLLASVRFLLRPEAGTLLGTFSDLMGPTLFFGVWLLYGFAAGQLFVWLCRKTILALLVSLLAAAAAIGLWLPSLLCGGMSGWQVWVTPLTMLVASGLLMRAWAGGRIWERKPMLALLGVGAGLGVWALVNFGYRAWEIADVGEPLDAVAFKAALPSAKDNAAGKVFHKAIGHFDEAESQRQIIANWWNQPQAGVIAEHQAKLEEAEIRWPLALAEAARLPVGVLETPRSDGQAPQLKHLLSCRKMAKDLRKQARTAERGLAFEQLAHILALSRNLRNKAPLESYLAGVDVEEEALEGLEHWLDRGKPDPKLLRRVLNELNRHAEDTPAPVECLRTECFRSGGLLENPNAWTFAARNGGGAIHERWLVGNIALSMEAPWEDERKVRLWQLVWAGLFRGIETPHWQLPTPDAEPHPDKPATGSVLHGWLPATEGPGAGVSRMRMIRLLDASWLADERLFCSVPRLRDAATRARWQVDATRQAVALALYRLEVGDDANDLHRLVPKYLPTGLPLDPYSGQPYRYRIAPENGRPLIWSTGPDGIDHGGHNHGGQLRDADAQWQRGGFDLITFVPHWR